MKFGLTYEFLDPAKGGHKTETSRIPAMKWYDEWNYKSVNTNPRRTDAEGPNGERLPIMLKFCTIHTLNYQKVKRFWQEGVSSPEAFEKLWIQLYGNFEKDMQVCVIEFDVLKAHIIHDQGLRRF